MGDIIQNLSKDIKREYGQYRRMGYSREDAIIKIRSCYEHELADSDDVVALVVGLTQALCEKSELTQEIACATLAAIQQAKENGMGDFSKTMELIKNPVHYGDEATYRCRASYVPDWQVGDTFSHTISCPASLELGIQGWSILLHKADAFRDNMGEERQIMYVFLCSSDHIPNSLEQLRALPLFPMMEEGEKWDYLAQIHIKSKSAERKLQLTKIGCFPGVDLPKDQGRIQPLTAMPLFGSLRKGDNIPDYEELICTLYRRFRGKRLG